MNDGLSRRELLESLKESKLLSAEDLERARSLDPAADGTGLAQALVEAGILTPFQRDELLSSRPEKLRVGNYDVLDKLGTGGTGTVFKARHRRMKRVVALKVLARTLCKDRTFVQRFQREVETIAQLSHPNIVMAYDADEADVGHFLVMEFVPGQDLATMVQDHGPMHVAEAVDCILQAARGLGYVHARGMIHRDIKPANLLRDATGTVKVTDLGLARFSSGGGGALNTNALTQAGGVLGSVDYMPPEQALDSTSIDHRADIYSLGATLYYLLTGRPPYPGQTMMETLLKHRDAPIPVVSANRKDVPVELDDLVRRMLAKSAVDRPQSMTEVVRTLESLQRAFRDEAALRDEAPALIPELEEPGPEVIETPEVPSDPDAVTMGPPPSENTVPIPRAVSDHTMDLTSLCASANAGLYVLVVEPSRTQASIIRKYLLSQEIRQVATVGSAKDALGVLLTDRPDAIIATMFLADMTGVELFHQLRILYPDSVPAFVLIRSESEDREVGALSRCDQAAELKKPFTPQQLVETLSMVTGQQLAVIPTSPEQLGLSLVRPIVLGPLPAAPEPEPEPLPPPRPLDHLRVLIVDDSKAARLQIRNVLAGIGVTQFAEAKDGAEAVALLARDAFGLVVTDYNMPLMDGRNLIAYLKQSPETAALPILMVTTETDPEKLEAVRALGVQVICDKQLPPEVVRNILEQLPHE